VCVFHRKLGAQFVKGCDCPGDFNQALMELGACVCTTANPLCRICPVRSVCRAFAEVRHCRRPVCEHSNNYTNNNTEHKFITNSTNININQNDTTHSNNNTVNNKTKNHNNNNNNNDNKYSSKSASEACKICAQECDIIGRDHSVLRYPMKKKKKAPRNENVAVCVVTRATNANDQRASTSEYLFVRRPSTGLLANQWEFCSVSLSASNNNNNNTKKNNSNNSNNKVRNSNNNKSNSKKGTLSVLYENRRKVMNEYLKALLHVSVSEMMERAVRKREDIGVIVHLFSHIRQSLYVEQLFVSVDNNNAKTKHPNNNNNNKNKKNNNDSGSGNKEEEVCYRWVREDDLKSLGLTRGMTKIIALIGKKRNNKPSRGKRRRKRMRKDLVDIVGDNNINNKKHSSNVSTKTNKSRHVKKRRKTSTTKTAKHSQTQTGLAKFFGVVAHKSHKK